jgi:hypothetical protein
VRLPPSSFIFFNLATLTLSVASCRHRRVREVFGESGSYNKHRSPFHHWAWLAAVSLIASAFLCFTIYNMVRDAIDGKLASGSGSCSG